MAAAARQGLTARIEILIIRNMSNKSNFDLDALAETFKALANPHRLAIFLRLSSCCDTGRCATDEGLKACVGEVSRELDVAPSTASHHLKALRQAGLVHMRRSGQNVECWVERTTLDELIEFFKLAGNAEFCVVDAPAGDRTNTGARP